ncbi:MAG: ankyrin repeat domain-containing protein [Pyrinomonadaceae bacterium]|nr:ankyrin repeat domain-containing protein [Pyrinomonadaceae bacterium]
MSHRRILLLLLLTLFLAPAALAQDATKQQLNEQLWEATRKGDAIAVKTLLDKGADVNALFRYGQTPLFKAAERGYTVIVQLLLERGADVNIRDTFYGATPMTWALNKGHVGVVRALLEKGVGSVDDVLMTGTRGGNVELVRAALDKGGARADTLTAALAAATVNGDKAEIAEMLKKVGAQPPLEVNAAALQAYAGSYKSEQGTVAAVTLKDGKFIAQLAGQQQITLMATDKTTFRPIEFDGPTFSFLTDGHKVMGFNLKQGANTTLFKRVDETKQQ